MNIYRQLTSSPSVEMKYNNLPNGNTVFFIISFRLGESSVSQLVGCKNGKWPWSGFDWVLIGFRQQILRTYMITEKILVICLAGDTIQLINCNYIFTRQKKKWPNVLILVE